MKQKDLVYWLIFAHLNRKNFKWINDKVNKLIIEIIHNNKSSLIDFFNLTNDDWQQQYKLTEIEASNLRKELEKLPNYAFLLEELDNNGIKVIVLNSPDYPQTLKDNLKSNYAPQIIYIKGNTDLLNQDAIAIVGARNANAQAIEFTQKVTKQEVKNNKCIVSGGAKGTDITALEEAMQSAGKSILVIPQGILTFSSSKYHQYIIEGNLLILSTFFPKAPWKTYNAMERNKIIYGLSKNIYISQFDWGKGGSWGGIVEGIKQNREIYIRKPQDKEISGNTKLIENNKNKINTIPVSKTKNLPIDIKINDELIIIKQCLNPNVTLKNQPKKQKIKIKTDKTNLNSTKPKDNKATNKSNANKIKNTKNELVKSQTNISKKSETQSLLFEC